MIVNYGRANLIALIVAVLLTSAVSAAPAPAPSGTPNARVQAIERGLRQVGLQVVGVEQGASPTLGSFWVATTKATYRKPSWKQVNDQAFAIWNVMYIVLRQGTPPETRLAAAEDWDRYRLYLWTRLGDFAQLSAAGQKTQEEQANAMATFAKTILFRVFDLKTLRFVDEVEFVKQNFAQD